MFASGPYFHPSFLLYSRFYPLVIYISHFNLPMLLVTSFRKSWGFTEFLHSQASPASFGMTGRPSEGERTFSESPTWAAAFPFGSVQLISSILASPLVSQSWNKDAPLCLVVSPPPQGKQDTLPASGWNVPRGHGRQGLKPSGEYSPGEHWSRREEHTL